MTVSGKPFSTSPKFSFEEYFFPKQKGTALKEQSFEMFESPKTIRTKALSGIKLFEKEFAKGKTEANIGAQQSRYAITSQKIGDLELGIPSGKLRVSKSKGEFLGEVGGTFKQVELETPGSSIVFGKTLSEKQTGFNLFAEQKPRAFKGKTGKEFFRTQAKPKAPSYEIALLSGPEVPSIVFPEAKAVSFKKAPKAKESVFGGIESGKTVVQTGKGTFQTMFGRTTTQTAFELEEMFGGVAVPAFGKAGSIEALFGEKPRVGLVQSPKTFSIMGEKTSLRLGFGEKTKPATGGKSITKAFESDLSKSISSASLKEAMKEFSTPRLRTDLAELMGTRTAQREKEALKTREAMREKTLTRTLTQTGLRSPLHFDFGRPTPFLKPKKQESFEEMFGNGGGSGPGFDVFVRTARPKKIVRTKKGIKVRPIVEGAFEKRNKKPLVRSQALSLGSKLVDNSIRATFKISPAKKKAVFDPGLSTSFNQEKFRSSKKNPELFVEKNEFRIDSPTEKRQLLIGKIETKKIKKRFEAF